MDTNLKIEDNLEKIINRQLIDEDYDEDITNDEIVSTIKKSGGRLLTNVEIFDIYTGSNVKEDEKSVAYSLKFEDSTRTLTDEEVMNVFNNIIKDVEEKLKAKVRNGE